MLIIRLLVYLAVIIFLVWAVKTLSKQSATKAYTKKARQLQELIDKKNKEIKGLQQEKKLTEEVTEVLKRLEAEKSDLEKAKAKLNQAPKKTQ